MLLMLPHDASHCLLSCLVQHWKITDEGRGYCTDNDSLILRHLVCILDLSGQLETPASGKLTRMAVLCR